MNKVAVPAVTAVIVDNTATNQYTLYQGWPNCGSRAACGFSWVEVRLSGLEDHQNKISSQTYVQKNSGVSDRQSTRNVTTRITNLVAIVNELVKIFRKG